MYRGTFNNQTFYCRTLHQANNVNSGINEPFNGDLLVTNEFLKLDYHSSMATNIQSVVRNLTGRGFTQRPVLSFSNEKCSEMTLL